MKFTKFTRTVPLTIMLIAVTLALSSEEVLRAQKPGPPPITTISMSTLSWPIFGPPSPCGSTLSFPAGTPGSFTVFVELENAAPNEMVTLTATGIPPGGSFNPPLPLTALQPASLFTWNPPAPGMMVTINLTAAGAGLQANCNIPIVTTTGTGQECLLLIGEEPDSLSVSPGDWLLTDVLIALPFVGSLPSLPIPSDPFFTGFTFYLQVAIYSPGMFPADPYVLSNGLEVTLGVGSLAYGSSKDITLWLENFPAIGGFAQPAFSIAPRLFEAAVE